MPRLIDELRARGAIGMPWFIDNAKERQWTDYARHIGALVLDDPELPVLLLNNVANYFYTGTDQEYWSLDKDFPNLAPPFQRFWCEYNMARTIHSTTGDVDMSQWLPQGGRVGQLFMTLRPEDVSGEGIPENVKWIYWCDMFIDYGVHREMVAIGPQGAVFLCVDAEGAAIGAPWMVSYCAEENQDLMKSLMAWYNPSFLAISFLHCGNVQMVDNVVDPKLAKRYRERHGVTPMPYKTLLIEPLKKVLRHEGRAHEHGLAKALHICRGHFKDYREGRGLFGKYHQLVWHPSLVRGTKGSKAPAREIEVKV